VATNAGGIPEIITHGKNGFLSEVGDVESMSANAIILLGNNDMLRSFGNEARKEAEQFDIANIVPQYETLYKQVLQNKP